MRPPINDINSQGMHRVSICDSHQTENQGVRPGQDACLARSRNCSGGRVLVPDNAKSLERASLVHLPWILNGIMKNLNSSSIRYCKRC